MLHLRKYKPKTLGVFAFLSFLILVLILILNIIFFISTAQSNDNENLSPVSNPWLDPRNEISNSARVLEQAYFIGEDSYDPNPDDILTYFWDFGDGETSNEMSPIHVYRQIGLYIVSLEVNDGYLSNTDTLELMVFSEGNHEPIAKIMHNAEKDDNGNNHANVNKVIYFDASDSYDPEGFGLYYEWEFGDGEKSSSDIAGHKYLENGIYTVILTVNDKEDLNSQDSISIIIGTGESKNSNGETGKPEDATGLGIFILVIVVVIIIILIIIWLFLSRLRKRATRRITIPIEQTTSEDKSKPKPAKPAFATPAIRQRDAFSRQVRAEKLASNEAKMRQTLMRKKLQSERKKADDDMKKEFEDMGIEF